MVVVWWTQRRCWSCFVVTRWVGSGQFRVSIVCLRSLRHHSCIWVHYFSTQHCLCVFRRAFGRSIPYCETSSRNMTRGDITVTSFPLQWVLHPQMIRVLLFYAHCDCDQSGCSGNNDGSIDTLKEMMGLMEVMYLSQVPWIVRPGRMGFWHSSIARSVKILQSGVTVAQTQHVYRSWDRLNTLRSGFTNSTISSLTAVEGRTPPCGRSPRWTPSWCWSAIATYACKILASMRA